MGRNGAAPDRGVIGDTETAAGFPPATRATFRNVADRVSPRNANCGRTLIRWTRPRAWVHVSERADIRRVNRLPVAT